MELENLKSKLSKPICDALEITEKYIPYLEKYILEYANLREENWIENFEKHCENSNLSIEAIIMVKNQEKQIISCIDSISEIVDQILILDTGSTDNTVTNIKKMKLDKLKLYQETWQEDFSYMRNKTLSLATGDWLLIIDSDETLNSDIDKDDLKKIINIVSFFCKDFLLQIEARFPKSPRFILPDRIIKNIPDFYFYGEVHEEIRSVSGNINRIQSSISVYNNGTLPSEMKKFDKFNRYTKLLKKMIKNEPNNPRWVTLSDKDTALSVFKDETYIDILLKFIKKDTTKNLTYDNVESNIYVKTLLQKYINELLFLNKNNEALRVVKFSRVIYPNNIDFLFYEYMLKKMFVDTQMKNIFDDFLFESIQLNEKSLFESQKDEQLLQALMSKMLSSLGEHKKSELLIDKISDPLVIDYLKMKDQVIR
ncbi:glycosyltransferase [Carnobacterium maltaromaticum]|uniref:glycosyltransferase n=1 Tax=Carnobacterium maltaromaticum TaxID=2751 RepID=UPI00295E21B2|nr:glycosyltransferase [Carnobacterium maltaromaticum]